MKYGSVCSGIEAATVAWHPLGWKPAFLSEIDKFPRAVLTHHYPHVPLHGDFTTIREGEYEPIDLLVGGTPCQSFSIAGLRGGMADPRGNLALAFLQLARRARPRWLVWENVPGVLSSNGGRDFGSILGGLGELGYGWSYRVLDAQYFGVAQRRRRVFVVGHLGDWRRAAAVLLEPESLRGDPAPRRETRKDLAPTISARPTGGGGLGTDFDLDGGLIAHSLRGEGFDASEDGSGRGTPRVPVLTLAIRGRGDSHDLETRADGTANAILTPNGGRAGIGVGAIATPSSVRRLTPRECERLQGFPDDYTLVPAFARSIPKDVEEETLRYIMRGNPDMSLEQARRWASHPDGPRYKALGNSMAVPVMRWIGERICAVDAIEVSP